jgi:hypothetical protein
MAHGDEHGRFIFRTAVHMVRALRDWYQAEHQRRTAAISPRPAPDENITEP